MTYQNLTTVHNDGRIVRRIFTSKQVLKTWIATMTTLKSVSAIAGFTTYATPTNRHGLSVTTQ